MAIITLNYIKQFNLEKHLCVVIKIKPLVNLLVVKFSHFLHI